MKGFIFLPFVLVLFFLFLFLSFLVLFFCFFSFFNIFFFYCLFFFSFFEPLNRPSQEILMLIATHERVVYRHGIVGPYIILLEAGVTFLLHPPYDIPPSTNEHHL